MNDGKPRARIITPFSVAHLELMTIRNTEDTFIQANLDKYRALAEIGHGGTMEYDGRILGALGFYENWPGNYEVWVIPSIYVAYYPRVFLRTVRGKLDTIAMTHAVSRFQSPAIADDFHDKWMRHFGFVNETPGGMPNYIGDQTYNMWGRINDLSSSSQ